MPIMEATSSGGIGLRYWLIVLILGVLGLLSIFSIGIYFWLLAIALIVLSPFGSRPQIFRPGIALFVGFLIGYVLIAPWGCSQSFTSNPTTGDETLTPVVCTSPIGVEYSGAEPFDPSRTPALVIGGISAVVASVATWLLTTSRKDEPMETDH
jgi:hypothetical protein